MHTIIIIAEDNDVIIMLCINNFQAQKGTFNLVFLVNVALNRITLYLYIKKEQKSSFDRVLVCQGLLKLPIIQTT